VQTLAMCMMGFIGANFGAISLQPFARIAGAAASAQGFLRMMAAALLGTFVGAAYDGTAGPIALAFVVAAVLTLLLVLYSERGQLFRRVYPAGTPRPEF
jgi:MFS transporter, DHA1 family, multidrug resistance protein